MRGCKAVKLFGEVLNHIVALRFAVHQHVDVQILLELDDLGHLTLNLLGIAGLIDIAAQESCTCIADLGSLRKRTDRCGGKEGQAELLHLNRLALCKRDTRAVRIGEGGGARADVLPADTGSDGTCGKRS